MPQQRSLFSFYARGSAGATTGGSDSPSNGDIFAKLKAKGVGPGQQNREFVAVESTVQESHSSQPDLLQKIKQKFVRKEHVDHQKKSGEASSAIPSSSSGPFIPGFKRVRKEEPSSSRKAAPRGSDQDVFINEKRAKLMEILGADDCSGKGGAWEEAKARFEWMAPDQIRDGNKRRPGDPLYDARTLHIPDDVFRKLSASQKQYWAVKRHYMDTILFFKVVIGQFTRTCPSAWWFSLISDLFLIRVCA